MAAGFEDAIDILEDTQHGAVDQKALVMLLAAKHDLALYDLRRWVDRVGIASSSVVSREKKLLEDRGIIDTEPEDTDIGRPRQRLTFDSSFESRDIGSLIATATDT